PQAVVPYAATWRQPFMEEQRDTWTPENTDAKFPRLFLNATQNSVYSSHWLMNGAYLRLKNAQLGYNLPTSIISRAKIQKARLYVTGENLWEVSKMWLKSYDPEVPTGANYQYPFFRTYSLGLNLTF
ncbi:MAG TPA: TonB-dependent receptor, partial [Sphingobacteriaceae bacterium]